MKNMKNMKIININLLVEKDKDHKDHIHDPVDESDFLEFCKTLNQHLTKAKYEGEKLMILKLVIDQYFSYLD